MANFLPIAFFDTLELAGSLRVRWGDFRNMGTGHRVLRVRGHAKDSDPAEDRFGRYPGTKGWVELDNLLGEIGERAVALMPPGVDEGLVFLEMLDPGAAVAWRGETEPYFERWSRAMIAIRSNPGVVLLAGHETMTPAVGMLNVVSPRLPRAALNMGEWPCVWLTIDFRKRTEAP